MQKMKLALALALCGASLAQAATVPSEVWFQDTTGAPYCDGITGVTKFGSAYTGTYDAATYCLTGTAAAGGPAARGLKPARALTEGASMNVDAMALYGVIVVFTVNTDGTWGLYDLFGNYLNRGVWSATPPAGARLSNPKPAATSRP